MTPVSSGAPESTGSEVGSAPSVDRRRVVITGVTGTLGEALARAYLARSFEVVGVSHREGAVSSCCHRILRSAQTTPADANHLLELDPDILILNAGRIETAVAPAGVPLADATVDVFSLNAIFPSLVVAAAGVRGATRRLDIVAVGSIADGSPSCFGPVYHASKSALHSFITGAGPIVNAAHPQVRVRLYRPGVIRGPLSWAPLLRLNEQGASIRSRRCRSAPEARVIAERIVHWIDGDAWVGSDPVPLSFRALQLLHAAAPDLYYRLQRIAWKRGSRFGEPTGFEPTESGMARAGARPAQPETRA